MTIAAWLSVILSLIARLAYFLYLSKSLLEAKAGAGGLLRYSIFKRRISTLQTLDGIVFIAACIASSGTLELQIEKPYAICAGMLLIVIGIGTKAWAVACLGLESYTWRDFFMPERNFIFSRSGPYRWFKDPMYTIGYLQVYGAALVTLSLPGLAIGVFMQGSMLVVGQAIERGRVSKLQQAAMLETGTRYD